MGGGRVSWGAWREGVGGDDEWICVLFFFKYLCVVFVAREKSEKSETGALRENRR